MIRPRHNRTTPRSWWDLFLETKGWLALIAGLALLGFTAFSVHNYRLAADLEAHGIWLPAEISNKRIRRGDDNDDYLVTFTYEVAGIIYSKQRDTGARYYRTVALGDEVQVKVAPHRPTTMEYREGQTHSTAILLQVIAGIAGALGCFGLWYSGSKANSAVLARKRGRRTTATIDSFTEMKNSGKPTGRGYMVFHTDDGLRGESLTGNIHHLRALGVGTKIVVFVRGKDVWWEGDTGPRAERHSTMPEVTRDDA